MTWRAAVAMVALLLATHARAADPPLQALALSLVGPGQGVFVDADDGTVLVSEAADRPVHPASVTKVAMRESWQRRIQEIETRARTASDERAVETLEAVNGRHLKAMRVVQGKALEALRTMSLADAMDAVRALDMAIRQERLILGEPTGRNAVSVEDVIKREYEKLMVDEDPPQNGRLAGVAVGSDGEAPQ